MTERSSRAVFFALGLRSEQFRRRAALQHTNRWGPAGAFGLFGGDQGDIGRFEHFDVVGDGGGEHVLRSGGAQEVADELDVAHVQVSEGLVDEDEASGAFVVFHQAHEQDQ